MTFGRFWPSCGEGRCGELVLLNVGEGDEMFWHWKLMGVGGVWGHGVSFVFRW